MKTIINVMCFCVFLFVSCNSSLDVKETKLLNTPVDKVNLTVENESFVVDFRFDNFCKQNYFDEEILPNVFAELKTRDDLINYYKTLLPGFLPGYSSVWPDKGEYRFVNVEYMLSQECFSNKCDSKIRKEVLLLVVDYQKSKFQEYTHPWCTQKSGVFLMAVILAKENAFPKFIDSSTLQKALLSLSSEEFITKEFSDLMIECSENFLTYTKN